MSLENEELKSKPPPPLDDPTVENPLTCPALKWGILGCGRVCHDFTQALKHVATATVVGCAARDMKRSREFSAKHSIPKAYDNYDDLIQDKDVQCVYVGTLHAFRREIGEKCLLADKNVVLEKPFACKYEDAQYLIELAKERNLFIMEGMWTRFFPAVEESRRMVFGTTHSDKENEKTGKIGEVVQVISEFNFNASDSEEYPTSFFYNRRLGGGVSYLVAPYPIAASTLFFKGATPDKVSVVGQTDTNRTGVDLQGVMTMTFPPTTPNAIPPAIDPKNKTGDNTVKLPGAGIAVCSYGLFGESIETTTVIGTKGRIIIDTPAHCPTKLRAYYKQKGRGNVVEEKFDFPLPADTDEIVRCGGYEYPNSAGFAYEAAAVARCIASGKKEAPQFTLKETLLNMKLVEESLKQLGVKPFDQE